MRKSKTVLWMKIAFMVGSLGAIIYMMSYFRSGAAFSKPDSAVGVLLGAAPATSEEKPTSDHSKEAQKIDSPASKEPENH